MTGTAAVPAPGAAPDYDVIVVGSGFGGSVTALRLAEKGYRVAVLEAGRRFSDADFAKTSWRLRDFLWAPQLGCFGIQRIHLLPDTLVLAGAGVGGGSLVYANTLYVPGPEFFADGHWSGITDWADELAPHYDQAKRMLGVVTNPTMTPADVAMKQVAEQLGVGHTFKLTPVGVFFGDGPGAACPDPFFGGAGPERAGCLECGECMTGCRHNAKNTLPKNYLGLAEVAGAEVLALTTVERIQPIGPGRWEVRVHRTGRPAGSRRSAARTLTANHVVISAGAYNTSKLLLRLRDEGVLPKLSQCLGQLARTNSESLVGAVADEIPGDGPDFTTGVAITSSFFPAPDTHMEPVRYGRGSNAMSLLTTVMTDGGEGERWKTWLRTAARDPRGAVRPLRARGWSQRSIIALVMQNVDNSLTLFGKRDRLGRWHMSSRQGEGQPNPTWIPVANDAVRLLAKVIGGHPMGNLGEVIDAPMTAHFVGGVVMGQTADEGVIDPYHRVHGYPGLHVVDGSSVSANLGVNPSLTITALAERAASLWPNKGQDDPRPALGQPYRRIDRVPPERPVVPAGAPGALR